MSDPIAKCVPILGLQECFKISIQCFLATSHRYLTSGEYSALPMDAAQDLELSSETAAVLSVYERERGSGRIGHKDQCTKPIVLRRRVLTKQNGKVAINSNGHLPEWNTYETKQWSLTWDRWKIERTILGVLHPSPTLAAFHRTRGLGRDDWTRHKSNSEGNITLGNALPGKVELKSPLFYKPHESFIALFP